MPECPFHTEVARRRTEFLSIFSEVFPTVSDELLVEAMEAEGVKIPCTCEPKEQP